MLKFFKSAPKPPATPARPATQARPRPAVPTETPLPPPLPEVSEGNEDSDWAMWEDSVSFQDSQMPSGFGDLDAVKTRDDRPKGGEPDPFSTVRRRGS